ncbi:MAG: hypothetical protein HYV68_03220 [Candidatus Taylorbacteria bacterium]|nr:hypothetical protein [Candidatus Taylorbacteria bacterium]
MEKGQNLTDNEEKMMEGLLYNSMSFGTTQEVFGELNDSGVQRLRVLRTIMAKYKQVFSGESGRQFNSFAVGYD